MKKLARVLVSVLLFVVLSISLPVVDRFGFSDGAVLAAASDAGSSTATTPAASGSGPSSPATASGGSKSNPKPPTGSSSENKPPASTGSSSGNKPPSATSSTPVGPAQSPNEKSNDNVVGYN